VTLADRPRSARHRVALRASSSPFPTLEGGLAYLDSAATSQTPLPVLEAMEDYYRSYRASVHRGVYEIAARATEQFEGARAKAAALVGSTPAETVFTRNATEAINLVAYSWGSANLREGDLIVLTEMEHHSNIVPWQLAAQRAGAEIAYVGVDDDGVLKLDELDALLAREPKLVGVTHVSNVLGTINDIAEITRRAHAAGAVVCVDGSQAVPHLPVDVGDADFYAWTGHKAYGPTGIGILHGKYELLEAMPPFLGGGHMIVKVSEQSSTYAEPPTKFEAGTSAVAEGIGLGAACDFLSEIGLDNVWAHDQELAAYALERLAEIPGLTIHGPRERVALVSFAIDGVHPHDVAEILGSQGVCVRAGHHCAQPLMRRLGTPATSRASFAIHSTRDDVDRLVDGLARVREIFSLD
jgi:cysteine desulfurase / selenocysteine lyase